MKQLPLVSIYTCVYNGARTIDRVFRSIKSIDYPNIEHIIVNDGSTDATEQLVHAYMAEVAYPVKYRYQENGGKHTALNVCWDIAEGEFMVQLDADDELLPHSIRFLVDTYYAIPEDIREQYWCVHGRFVNQHGQFVGDPYPEDINHLDWREALKIARKSRRDKIGLQLSSRLKHYRFPEVVGLSHIPEGMLWRQIENLYGTWYTNEVIAVNYVGEGGNLTAQATQRRQFSPRCYKVKWRLMHPEWYPFTPKDLLLYSLYYFISDKRFRSHNQYTAELERYRLPLWMLCPLTIPGAWLARQIKHIQK
nr:glycosyltransferase family 2 protein [Clostridia bacterium]